MLGPETMVEIQMTCSSKFCFRFDVLEESLGKVHSVSEKVSFIFHVGTTFQHQSCCMWGRWFGTRFQRRNPGSWFSCFVSWKSKEMFPELMMRFYDFSFQLWWDVKRILGLVLIVFLTFVLKYLENFALCHLFHRLRLCAGVCVCVFSDSAHLHHQYFFPPSCD